MRTSDPRPNEAWPHDMVVTVDDQPNSLLELLWVREAYELRPIGQDLPPKLADRPTVEHNGDLDAATRGEWERAWPGLWRDAVAHAAIQRDPNLFEQLGHPANGSLERANLLAAMTGPNWGDRFGSFAFETPNFTSWMTRQSTGGPSWPLDEPPERRALAALVPAWRAGLTVIITIPCIDGFTRRIDPNALILTNSVREDPAAYWAALTSFA